MLRKIAGPLFMLAIILFLIGKIQGNSFGLGSHARSVAAGPGERSFIKAVLSDLGAPATFANVSSLAAWFTHEFPGWPPWARNNPMASTLDAPGATVYNSVGVRNYPSATVGAEKTAETLSNGHYPGIVAALKAGEGLCGGSHAREFLVWSGSGYSSVC